MKPLNKTLMTSAAALVLVAGSAFAQDVSTDTEVTGDVATEGTSMNSDTDMSTDMDASGGDMTADAEMGTETDMETDLETAAEETGEAIENTAEDVADAAENTAEDIEQGAEEMAADAENAAEEAGDEMNEMAADAETSMDGEMSADAGIMDPDLEAAADVEISSLIGVNVVSQDGNDVGEIDNFYMLDNKVWAVVGIGGFLGIGEHDVAIDLANLAVNETTDEGEVSEFMITGYTEADLEAMEEFDSETATVIDSTSSLRAASGS